MFQSLVGCYKPAQRPLMLEALLRSHYNSSCTMTVSITGRQKGDTLIYVLRTPGLHCPEVSNWR